MTQRNSLNFIFILKHNSLYVISEQKYKYNQLRIENHQKIQFNNLINSASYYNA